VGLPQRRVLRRDVREPWGPNVKFFAVNRTVCDTYAVRSFAFEPELEAPINARAGVDHRHDQLRLVGDLTVDRVGLRRHRESRHTSLLSRDGDTAAYPHFGYRKKFSITLDDCYNWTGRPTPATGRDAGHSFLSEHYRMVPTHQRIARSARSIALNDISL